MRDHAATDEGPRAPSARDLDAATARIGRRLAEAYPPAIRHPGRALDRRAMLAASSRPDVQAALFRFVDAFPACRTPEDLAEHLAAYCAELDDPPAPLRAPDHLRRSGLGARATALAASAGVTRMARRFILGSTPRAALPALRALWDAGAAVSLDLLGEATVTAEEADRYAARCRDAIAVLAGETRSWPDRPILEHDGHGVVPRANLSVKVSALTPLLRPHAPELGQADAARRLRPLLRQARDAGAHLHVDSESLDSLETTIRLVLDLLAEEEFATGPSVGVVLQGYLRDSVAVCDRLLAWARARRRTPPLTIRLVKGAYWDHEVADARQRGWTPPVFTDKGETDRSFEALTRRLLDARDVVRLAVGSHNLRSVAHALAYNRLTGGSDADVELQVLQGLGDDLRDALAEEGFRVRAYCPVGELVEGMAYLVRRLLENTASTSFLRAHDRGTSLRDLLSAP